MASGEAPVVICIAGSIVNAAPPSSLAVEAIIITNPVVGC